MDSNCITHAPSGGLAFPGDRTEEGEITLTNFSADHAAFWAKMEQLRDETSTNLYIQGFVFLYRTFSFFGFADRKTQTPAKH
jgi:hypothetical protein